MIKPITPEEADGRREFPYAVIKAFNDLIVRNLVNGRAKFFQKDVVDEIVKSLQLAEPDCSVGHLKERVYAEKWLNIDDVYRKSGWEVSYDKPGHDESYDASFIFKIPSR